MEQGSSKHENTQPEKQLPENSAENQGDEIDRIIEETRQDTTGNDSFAPEINIIGIEKQEKKKYAKMKAANKKEKKTGRRQYKLCLWT